MPTVDGQVDDASPFTPRFLKHILPHEGWYALAIFREGRVSHSWSLSIDELAATALEADQRGLTVYHACAAYRERGSRKQVNARAARSLWSEIDIRSEKHPEIPYANAREAFEACERARNAIGLPQPVYVASGYGVHAYWPLVSDLDPATWKRYAEGLKAALQHYGLVIDPSRTADIASILRPPGTHHRKGEPRLVTHGPLVGPYSIETFEGLLSYAPAPRHAAAKMPPLARAMGDVFEHAPRYSEAVAGSCGQLGRLRDTGGNVSEPLWYDCLGVLAYCEDGKKFANEWSSGYDGYTEQETTAKLEQWRRETDGPTTCEHFHGLDAKICEACPHWQKIKSPISLASRSGAEHDRPQANKPRLLIEDCNPDCTVAALRDILAGAAMLYDRGVPVRLVVDQVQRGTVAQVMSPDALVLMAHTVCRPYVLKAKDDHNSSEANARLPRQFAVMYLDWRGEWRLLLLNGIATAPLLDADGTINSAEGYDPNSGMWCERVSDLAGLVPDQPNRDQAQAALHVIRETFKTFCFADAVTADVGTGVPVVDTSLPPGRDETAFLVAMLTAVCRPSLYLAPGVLLRAAPMSGAGAGKGLLARCICIVAFGIEPHAVTAGGTSEELEKRIAAELMEGSSTLFLDNLNNTEFKSDLLASAITERPAKVRVLGKSQMVLLNASAFVILTGNGLTISEDMVRRFIAIDFDPLTENPEAREFKTDIRVEVTNRRKELLAALLTIWRWGRITLDIKPGLPLGSFEQWCRWVRDPLLALGCQDPVERVREAKERDGRRQVVADIFNIWWEKHGPLPVKVRDLHDGVKQAVDPQGRGRQYLASEVGKLAGTRIAGFVFTRQASAGKWGAATYALKKTDSSLEA